MANKIKRYLLWHSDAIWHQGSWSSWGQHGAHLGPTGPRWAPCWPHKLCCLGLVQVKVCCLSLPKALPKSIVIYCSLDRMWKKYSVKVESKYDIFIQKVSSAKCRPFCIILNWFPATGPKWNYTGPKLDWYYTYQVDFYPALHNFWDV